MMPEELADRFTYHPPTGTQPARYAKIRAAALALADCIIEMVPQGREQSLALTNVEQGAFWANAGIARH